ncbi:cytochrome c4 [Bermanella marisrubri]|uniref:Cytochrome c4 n=1 Tax=Bermanella marisrubri TaxID=207949 RepID=Q1MZ86_9GAMM|nr:c-type cytochrome [Bermanella marisrubri]EAT11247.1 cytochrome c4 [Oceanobacter sp. RED65] [Bermanella marisrubri]QIZ82730.1 cytochrome c4 [Bermanella marisrubri]
MKKLAISLMLSLGLVAGADAGDAAAGKKIAGACAACHGQDGNSPAPSFPKIAGLGEAYIYKQLMDFKSGERQNAIMMGQVAALSEKQMQDLAAYYNSQTRTVGYAAEDKVELGQKVYRAGNTATGVPACMACHSMDGSGMDAAGFPALGGQHADYIKSQLVMFQEDKRANDNAQVMRDIAKRMSNKEIDAVSSYIQGLHR